VKFVVVLVGVLLAGAWQVSAANGASIVGNGRDGASKHDSSKGHPLTLDDILRMEGIGKAELSPDGELLLFEYVPPYESAPNLSALQSTFDLSPLSTLLLIEGKKDSKPVRVLTHARHAGHWSAGFSPDGKRLAIYSLESGKLSAGVFEFRDRQLTTFDFIPNYSTKIKRPLWISAEELIYAALGPGQLLSQQRLSMANRMQELWLKTFEGVEPSVTEIHSTKTGLHEAGVFRDGRLILANARTGVSREIAQGEFYDLQLSPDGRYVAALKQGGRIQHQETRYLLPEIATRSQLVVFDTKDGYSASVPCESCNVLARTLAWSADGRELTFLAHDLKESFEQTQLFRYTPATRALETFNTEGFQFACTTGSAFGGWIRPSPAFGGRAIAFGRKRPPEAIGAIVPLPECDRGARNDWFALDTSEEPRNLTAGLADVSCCAVSALDSSVILLANGDVWSVRSDGSRTKFKLNVIGPFSPWEPQFDRPTRLIAGTTDESARALSVSHKEIVLQSRTHFILLNPERGTYKSLVKPSPRTTLLDLGGGGASLVFREDTGTSSKLLFQYSGVVRTVIEINKHLEVVRQVPKRYIAYDAPNGAKISACAFLPPNWTPEKRWPMITYVYPARSKGVCVGDDLARFTPMNYQLLANHGYVVLFPAAPRSLIQTPSGPTAGITPVVNAAIDRAIEELSVDAERLGLYGFSQGYHVALQILTETNRFKAAAVGNGLANFASAYGSTTMWSRFEGAEVVPLAARFEGASSPNRLGVQPWQDPDRYIQNSPISCTVISTAFLLDRAMRYSMLCIASGRKRVTQFIGENLMGI
jgi:dipeptidyl aminopeptidase/acylaminoacyl peptidase